MATAGKATLTTADTILFKDENGCTSFFIRATAGSSNPVLVNVPGLHADGEYFSIPAGKENTFSLNNLGIRKVVAKGDGGVASVEYGIVSKTLGHGRG